MSEITEAIQKAIRTEATGEELVRKVQEAYHAKVELEVLDDHLRDNYAILWAMLQDDLEDIKLKTKQKTQHMCS